MGVQWVLVCHGLITLLVVVSFHRIHVFLTFGAYDYLQRFVTYVFGTKGTNAILSIEYYCCDRPNPILQAIYLAIFGVTYYFIVSSSFNYIPGHYISGAHRYISMAAVGVGILLFLLTSFSDPGTVNNENFSRYITAYPYDNTIYIEKECSTCKFPKPARSKHCSICDRCVARFDHHCGWMNNCIGERNTRYFVAFLIWHFILCIYGAVAIALILAGQLKELQIIYILTEFYGIENQFSSLAPHVVQAPMPFSLSSAIAVIVLTLFTALGEAFFPSPIAAKQFVVVGAGGAGRALAFGAKTRGARVNIFYIDFDRAKSLAQAVCGEARPFEDLANFQPEKGAILANATRIGMHTSTDRIPVAQGTLKDYRLVFDAVYTPRKNTLLRDAENAGVLIVSGVELFLRQAIGQFNLFTGSKAPEDFMRAIVMEKF